MKTILVPSEEIPIIDDADICVVGGSCTGVFAAVRAARLGAKVVIVERQNRFGGVATSSLVNMWHNIYDTDFSQQIIGGLTFEIMERLAKRNAIAPYLNSKELNLPFNSEELTIELDELVKEANVKVHFHTFFSAPVVEDGRIKAIIVQNKSGRAAITAKIFIDASGDGDLCYAAGIPTYLPEYFQPPTTCAKFSNWNSGFESVATNLIMKHAEEFNLPAGCIWGTFVPPDNNVYMLNGSRIFGKNTSVAEDLTICEIEGRRQVRAIMDIFRKYCNGKHPELQALPSMIGVRETRHIRAQYHVTGEDLLFGKKFDDAIANGTYRVDIHHQEKPGVTFKYLNGVQHYICPGKTTIESRWREENADYPKYYQIPLRSLIPNKSRNLIAAGRMLDADKVAFGGIRVMVNLNQTGEAAGVAAWHALNANVDIHHVDCQQVRKTLADGGSCIL